MINLNFTFICLSIVLAWCTVADAQEAKPKPKVDPPTEMLSLKVLVTDPEGNPVEEAVVSPHGMRTKVERGSWWSWMPERHGERPKVSTNAEGIAVIPYPKYTMEKLETGELDLSVKHPEFIPFSDDRNVDDDPAKVALARGFRIAATAVDETGEPIKTGIYGTTSLTSGKWSLKKNGILVSPTMKKEDCVLRIVQIEEGQPVKFSKRIEVKPGTGSRVMLKDHQLSVGVRVEGKLDESVKRPIINGHVAARIHRRPASDEQSRRNKWRWSDRAEILKDGSFVFESLPPDEVLQLIAVCHDWVPAKPILGDVLKHFPEEKDKLAADWGGLPRILQLPAEAGKKMDVTLKMIPAKSVKVTVNDPEGSPIAGAKVLTNPNQYWFDAGSQLLGAAYRTRDHLTEPDAELKDEKPRYFGETDDNGIAILHDFPPNSPRFQSIYIDCEGYELPIAGRDRKIDFEFADEGITKVVAQMQAKGTEVMDGSEVQQQRAQEQGLMKAAQWLNNLFQGK